MRARQPSLGFVAVCLTYGLVIAFFLWGFSTPDLDRAWTLHHALKTGQMKRLRAADRELLHEAMARHPALARALLGGREIGLVSAHSDGWIATPTATVIRTPESGSHQELLLEVQTPRDLIPYTVEVRTPGWKKTLKVTERGTRSVPIPDPPETSEILEVRMRGRNFKADPSMLGLRIVLPARIEGAQ
jgi:hypothetical protein